MDKEKNKVNTSIRCITSHLPKRVFTIVSITIMKPERLPVWWEPFEFSACKGKNHSKETGKGYLYGGNLFEFSACKGKNHSKGAGKVTYMVGTFLNEGSDGSRV